jgi:ABC-type lipoprotein release transport system permease subunit
MALRSLWAHKVKSAIVGGIMFFGTFLVMTGSALLDSIERSMEQSITSSMAGNLQVYSADAKDALALFGGGFGSSDIGDIEDFGVVKRSLMQVPNVRAVVPMGITQATSFNGNEIDRVLDDLRKAVTRSDGPAIALGKERGRKIATTIQGEYHNRAAISADPEKVATDEATLARATSDEFWSSFDADPLGSLDWLDGHLAPLAADGQLMYLRTIGTDLDEFTKDFDRFYIVDGEMVPSGKRGFLLSKRTYEKFLKNLVAKQLDDVNEKLADGGTIAQDPTLQQEIANNVKQYTRITYQLSPEDEAALEPKLRALLHDEKSELTGLVQAFLAVDDASFAERYKFFYDEIAPHIRLYAVKVGDVLTLRAYTKSGYMRSVNVRVYGTYEFKGLEKSDLASASNLTDLVTWRELYGKMSGAQLSELQGIKKEVGVKDVSAENAEDELFGGGAPAEVAPAPAAADAGFDEFAGVTLSGRSERAEEIDNKTYSRDEFEHGLFGNAAILLDDPSKLAATQRAVAARSDADGLGLKVVDWQAASGLVGQFIEVMRGVLYTAIFVVYLVALVIINNAMVMATMERTAEIGTMRAVGAARAFVVLLFLLETILLGLIAGAGGALASGAFIGWLSQVGLPSGGNNILIFLFAGPRMYPSIGCGNLLFGLASILVVSLLSTLYPAFVAAGVPPVVAMQGKGD